ncbi:Potassium/proton antiporter [Planctomycetales bacterium 10988]|nr:Potassium/proton antiporter [Planctomycetales bacterium 10988]
MKELMPIYLVSVLSLGVISQWLAWRMRLPAIMLLLLVGFISGFVAQPEEYIPQELLFAVVSLSVAVILFEGGLSLRFHEIKETGHAVFRLVTIGVLVTWLLASAAMCTLLDFGWGMALVLGAIFTVSGPTVIIPLLRDIQPKRRIGNLVKWEGIVNDPIGAVLAVLAYEAVVAGGFREAAFETMFSLVKALFVGIIGGLIVALVLVFLLKRYWIPDYLQNTVLLTAVLISFALSNWVQHESGLITVTVLGVYLANQRQVSVSHIIEFKENLRVILIGCLFIVLASRLQIEQIIGLGWQGLAFVGLLLLFIRPLAVFLSTWGTSLTWRERTFLGWLHPRGIVAAAVSSVFALDIVQKIGGGSLPESMKFDADRMVPVAFSVIVGTVGIYGLTASLLARWLKIADPDPQGLLFAGADPFVRAIAKALHVEGYHVLLVDSNHRNIAAARMQGLPAVNASILSEFTDEHLDFGGIGRLLSMTANDEVNTLAALQFTERFGRADLYQLAPASTESYRQETVSADYRGRILFSPDLTHEILTRKFAAGAKVKKTTLSSSFTYEDYLSHYKGKASILFVMEESNRLIVHATDMTLKFKSGQKLISLVDPDVLQETEKAGADDSINRPKKKGNDDSINKPKKKKASSPSESS